MPSSRALLLVTRSRGGAHHPLRRMRGGRRPDLLEAIQGGRGMRGIGRAMLAATLLLIAGTLNIIYGIGALDDANIFVNDKRFIFTDLNTMGWVLIVLGIIQLTAGFSLFAGNAYGRVIGIVAASLGAISALLSVGGNDPWWSLGIFFLCVWIVHGIFVYGGDERAAVT